MNRLLCALVLLASAISQTVAAASPDSGSVCAECRFDFGTVFRGTEVTHLFPLRNPGDQVLRITGVQLSPPLQLAKMPAIIAPGHSAMLQLTLDTSGLNGEYSGQLLVAVDGLPAAQRAYSFSGKVTPAIEVLPRPAVFLSTSRGSSRSATLDIINHEREPLSLAIQTPPAAHYSARLQAVRPGQHYRLTVTIPASAPAGRNHRRLELKSSSSTQPIVYVGINSNVRERVYTFPDVVDFGQVRMSDLRAGRANQLGGSQTLMVYQTGGHDFSVAAQSTLAGIGVVTERGPNGDRVQITLSLLSGKLAPGTLRGSVRLRSNDPQFRELMVPVAGEILAD